MASYNHDQQIFCLNIISNFGNMYRGTSDQIAAQTATAINSVLGDAGVKALIGNWQCVWGPKVLATETRSLNTMFIAKNMDSNEYVVSIAGTDSKSFLDWFLEDFLVVTKIYWPYVNTFPSTDPMISLGTYIGLTALTSMAEVNGDVHLHARDYLGNVGAKNVTVTGHSLGGALSPAYALYLNDTISQWSNGTPATISCLAAAGATPGDRAFSDYYDSQLGATTNRVWNSKDVVPHGFEQDMLAQIATLYQPALSTPIAVKAAVDSVRVLTAFKNYKQLMPSVQGFVPACNNLSSFENEILCQHICAYADHFRISAFQAAVQTILGLPQPYFSDGCSS